MCKLFVWYLLLLVWEPSSLSVNGFPSTQSCVCVGGGWGWGGRGAAGGMQVCPALKLSQLTPTPSHTAHPFPRLAPGTPVPTPVHVRAERKSASGVTPQESSLIF